MFEDTGYSGYDDPRLQPEPEPEMEPAGCWQDCVHADACRNQLARLRGFDVDYEGFGWMDELAEALGCGEGCECMEF